MQKKIFCKFFWVILLIISFTAHTASGKALTSLDELLNLLPKGEGGDQPTKEIIDNAQFVVAKDYTNNRPKMVMFGKPIDVFALSPKYTAVSFEANVIKSGLQKKSVFMLLFEHYDTSRVRYADVYLTWVGDVEAGEYGNINEAELCKRYQDKLNKNICKSEKLIPKEDEFFVKLAGKADIKHTHSFSDITSVKIKDEFIDDSITRDSELKAAISSALKSDIGAINSNISQNVTTVKSMEMQIVELQKTVNRLVAILKDVSRNGNTIMFSGVNVQIVNGTGKTDAPVNGLGNLIVGYNEPTEQGTASARKGSHNIVVGSKNSYSSYGGLVVGISNTISGAYATVSGGYNNTATGAYSSISGGHLNKAKGDYSSISGGLTRTVTENNNWRGGEQFSAQ